MVFIFCKDNAFRNPIRVWSVFSNYAQICYTRNIASVLDQLSFCCTKQNCVLFSLNIELSESEVNLSEVEEVKQLMAKFKNDLVTKRKRHEFFEIDIQEEPKLKLTDKRKLTDELFNQYLSQGLSVKEISIKSG